MFAFIFSLQRKSKSVINWLGLFSKLSKNCLKPEVLAETQIKRAFLYTKQIIQKTLSLINRVEI